MDPWTLPIGETLFFSVLMFSVFLAIFLGPLVNWYYRKYPKKVAKNKRRW